MEADLHSWANTARVGFEERPEEIGRARSVRVSELTSVVADPGVRFDERRAVIEHGLDDGLASAVAVDAVLARHALVRAIALLGVGRGVVARDPDVPYVMAVLKRHRAIVARMHDHHRHEMLFIWPGLLGGHRGNQLANGLELQSAGEADARDRAFALVIG